MPVILHGMALSGPCRSVLVTGKAIGVDIQMKQVDVFTQGTKTEAFMKMNPNHTIPTLEDNGFILWESRPIMSYLVDKYAKDDKLYPKEVKARALVDQMLDFDLGSLSSRIAMYIFPKRPGGEAPNPEQEPEMRDKLTTLEKIVAKSPFAAGKHVTIADISIVTTLTILYLVKYPLDNYPNIVEYVDNFKKKFPIYDQVCKTGEQQVTEFINSKLKK